MDPDTAGTWVEALDARAGSADQTALRRRLVELVRARPGHRVLEIGCGTGALLVDLARAVGPGGRVVGVEPQPAFAAAARRRLQAAGVDAWSTVIEKTAEDVPLPDASFDAAVAQTVLIHLPAATRRATLARMAQAVQPGGWVASADQDGDTWIIDHPDRELTRRIVRFNSDQRYADGWTGRSLYRLFRVAGLRQVTVEPWVHVDTAAGSYLHAMAERLARAACAAGAVSAVEGERWLAQLRERAATGDFFSSINFYLCVGRK